MAHSLFFNDGSVEYLFHQEGTSEFLESNTTAFQEILQVCLEMKNELVFSKRLNKQTLTEFIKQIQEMINNQI